MRIFMLIIHLLGVAMAVGVSFTHFFLGRSRAKMTKEDAVKDVLRSFSLGIMGDIGLTFLILSGLYMMTPYWPILFTSPFLIAKLSLVVILIVLLVIIRVHSNRAIKENGGPAMLKIKKIAQFTLPMAIAIVVLAVLNFH